MWSILSTIHVATCTYVHVHAHVHHWETCRLIFSWTQWHGIHCEYAQKILVSPVDDPGHRCDVTNNGTSLNESIPQTCDDEGVCQYDSCLMYTWGLRQQSWQYCFWTNWFWKWWGCTYLYIYVEMWYSKVCHVCHVPVLTAAILSPGTRRSRVTADTGTTPPPDTSRPSSLMSVSQYWVDFYHLSCIQRYALAAIN